jgi:hypothetical protein
MSLLVPPGLNRTFRYKIKLILVCDWKINFVYVSTKCIRDNPVDISTTLHGAQKTEESGLDSSASIAAQRPPPHSFLYNAYWEQFPLVLTMCGGIPPLTKSSRSNERTDNFASNSPKLVR